MQERAHTGEMEARLAQLRFALRVSGAGWLVFWLALGANELTGSALWDATSWIAPYVMWGHGGQAYLLMLVADNLAIALFMLLSARDPLAHKLFVDFALVANGAHMASMLVMAASDAHEHSKLLGDVPLGVIPTAVLAWLWLRVRNHGGRGRALSGTDAAAVASGG